MFDKSEKCRKNLYFINHLHYFMIVDISLRQKMKFAEQTCGLAFQKTNYLMQQWERERACEEIP